VVADNTRIYLDARQKRRACKNAVAPRGTPVSAAVETRDAMQAVVMLDALWEFAPPRVCEPVHTGSVWVPASSISSDFPR